MKEKQYSLKELNLLVREVVKKNLPEAFWVVAEISEIRIQHQGHCYLELVEKSSDTEGLVARARATIWASVFRFLQPYFESTTQQVLREGLKILVRAQVEFHELYGHSLNITDIDPAYTLGDLAALKAETLRRLEKEGVIDMNKGLPLPPVVQRIAVISSAQAAGYQDFTEQLAHNPYGFVYYPRLFPAIMQGKESEVSITQALDRIFQHEDLFEVVVLIRGGGAQSDLISYNHYRLAYHITQFPLPVLTGIGHEKDESVADMVAHTRLKTPTAVAEFLIGHNLQFENHLSDISRRVFEMTEYILKKETSRIQGLIRIFSPLVLREMERRKHQLSQVRMRCQNGSRKSFRSFQYRLSEVLTQTTQGIRTGLQKRRELLSHYSWRLKHSGREFLRKSRSEMEVYEKSMQLTDPANVLRRGYSITRMNKKVLRNSSGLKNGDMLETLFYKGKINSKVCPPPAGEGTNPDQIQKDT